MGADLLDRVLQETLEIHFPGVIVLGTVLPPGQAVGEVLELDGLGLGEVLPALGEWNLVVPDLFRRPVPIKKRIFVGMLV